MSRRPPDPEPEPVFFVDRCLGSSIVPAALRAAGWRAEAHDDHFAQDTPDEVWIPDVGARGWLVLTRDRWIRRREAEWAALVRGRVAAFILTGGKDLPGSVAGAAFVQAARRMVNLARAHRARPMLCRVSVSGAVERMKLDAQGRILP